MIHRAPAPLAGTGPPELETHLAQADIAARIFSRRRFGQRKQDPRRSAPPPRPRRGLSTCVHLHCGGRQRRARGQRHRGHGSAPDRPAAPPRRTSGPKAPTAPVLRRKTGARGAADPTGRDAPRGHGSAAGGQEGPGRRSTGTGTIARPAGKPVFIPATRPSMAKACPWCRVVIRWRTQAAVSCPILICGSASFGPMA